MSITNHTYEQRDNWDTEAMWRLITNNKELYNIYNECTAFGYKISNIADMLKPRIIEAMPSTEPKIDIDRVNWYMIADNSINPYEKERRQYIQHRMNAISDIRKFAMGNPITIGICIIFLTHIGSLFLLGNMYTWNIVTGLIIAVIVRIWSEESTILRDMDHKYNRKRR